MEEAYIVYILSAHRERERERERERGGGGYRVQINNKCSEHGCWNLKKGHRACLIKGTRSTIVALNVVMENMPEMLVQVPEVEGYVM